MFLLLCAIDSSLIAAAKKSLYLYSCGTKATKFMVSHCQQVYGKFIVYVLSLPFLLEYLLKLVLKKAHCRIRSFSIFKDSYNLNSLCVVCLLSSPFPSICYFIFSRTKNLSSCFFLHFFFYKLIFFLTIPS